MSQADQIKGALFGQAIGDALGAGTEFMTRAEVQQHYPTGLRNYSQIREDAYRSFRPKGYWTDDTEMMLCIARSLIKEKEINYTSIASEFKAWYNTNPPDIGNQTRCVLGHPQYEQEPFRVSRAVWQLTGEKSAGNGGIMRTSIVGLLPCNVIKEAESICKLTHFDPRCVGSCVIYSILIHSLVYHNTVPPMSELKEISIQYDEQIEKFLNLAESETLTALTLDDKAMGYTLKTLAAALWCLHHCNSFEEGLFAMIDAGGDADTNAAVACSLLGAKYGYHSIPHTYIDGLIKKEELNKVAEYFETIHLHL